MEEWFYLFFPLLLFISKRSFGFDVKKSFAVVCIFVVLLIPFLRYAYYVHYDIIDEMSWRYFIRQITVLRFNSIIFGVIGAYLYNFKSELWVRYKKEALICGLLSIFIFKSIENWNPELLWNNSNGILFMSVYYFTIMSFCILLLLPYLSDFKTDRKNIFIWNITKISIISYSVYLSNYSLVKNYMIAKQNLYFSAYLSNNYISMLNVFLFYSLTIGLSILLYRYFELPTMGLRDKI